MTQSPTSVTYSIAAALLNRSTALAPGNDQNHVGSVASSREPHGAQVLTHDRRVGDRDDLRDDAVSG
jgi:hypothetical protein